MRLWRWLRRLLRGRKREAPVVAKGENWADEKLVEIGDGRLLRAFNALNVHERDFEYEYDKESGRYMFGPRPLQRLSELIANQFEPVDDIALARRVAQSRGVEADRLLERWHETNEEARRAGELLHNNLEQILLGEECPVSFVYFFNGQNRRVRRVVSLIDEINQIVHFAEREGIVPYRTLWHVYDEEAGLISRLDLVARDRQGRLMLVDLVRSNRWGAEVDGQLRLEMAKRYGTGKGYLEHVPDGDYERASLKLAVERRILAKYYGLEVERRCILVVHHDYSDYHLVDALPMEKEAGDVLYEGYYENQM